MRLFRSACWHSPWANAFWNTQSQHSSDQPISLNYHFTRRCNMKCGVCFHTATTSHIQKIEDAKASIRLLKDAWMRKLKFTGGEPFLHPRFLGALVALCKGIDVECLPIVKAWCDEHKISFTLKTVVRELKWQKDMNQPESAFSPWRCKCFQTSLRVDSVMGQSTSSLQINYSVLSTCTKTT